MLAQHIPSGSAPVARCDDRSNLGQKPDDMTWHDHLIQLLTMGSELEHALMVQYLFAAYSIGGEQVPSDYRPMVHRWQESLLTVAREEMGHLLTVQNMLIFLRAGTNFNRENFPWDVQYQPFPFVLERFSRESLACYIFAEMPNEGFKEKDEIEAMAHAHARKLGAAPDAKMLPVGEVYKEIIQIVENENPRIKDSSFDPDTYSFQASWDDWGRRYGPADRKLTAEGFLAKEAEQLRGKRAPAQKSELTGESRACLLIHRIASRTQFLRALRELSEQGEGPRGTAQDGEWSHFQRFIAIWREWNSLRDQNWAPSRNVTLNPTTRAQQQPAQQEAAGRQPTCIESPRTRNWAHLFNLRYRLLLNVLAHTFRLARTGPPNLPGPRGVMLSHAFREMYNLKTIAGILVQLPIRDYGNHKSELEEILYAGPPFEMPYTLMLPLDERDVIRMHDDVLASSQQICHRILKQEPRPADQAYLNALLNLDDQTRAAIAAALAGGRMG